MPEVTIPTGQERDGWIVIGVNGVLQWIKAGVPTELDASEIEVLGHAGLDYTLANGAEPLIFADFKNGVYIVDGESVAFEDIVVENEAEYGPWNPLLLVEGVGISVNNDAANSFLTLNPALAASRISEGATIVPTLAGDGVMSVEMLDLALPSANADLRWQIDTLGEITSIPNTPGGVTANDDNGLVGPPTKAALNFSRLRMAGSLNGRPVVGEDLFEQSVPFTTSGFNGSSTLIIESIGWYPLQDEADLPSLSAL